MMPNIKIDGNKKLMSTRFEYKKWVKLAYGLRDKLACEQCILMYWTQVVSSTIETPAIKL